MKLNWDGKEGHLVFSSGTFLPLAERPVLPFSYNKLNFADGKGTKVLSGVELQLTATECFMIEKYLQL